MSITVTIFAFAAAAATGSIGLKQAVDAVNNHSNAKKIVVKASEKYEQSVNKLEIKREEVSSLLEKVGELKINILKNSVNDFLTTFEKIKNVEIRDSSGLRELYDINIDKIEISEIKKMSNMAINLTEGAAAGAFAGSMIAFGAYSAAMGLASASTGTAISTLSGVAATNATLAFFGGGSIASGGLGMAVGQTVLGSIAVGPGLLAMGLILSAKSQQEIDKALTNKDQLDAAVSEMESAISMVIAIRRRASMLYNLLVRLDSRLLALTWQMQDIVENEGYDYRMYQQESKNIIIMAYTTLCSVRAVLDTPLLMEDGSLSEKSAKLLTKEGIEKLLV